MPSTELIRPNNVVGTPTGWSDVGAFSTLWEPLADGTSGAPIDTTYVTNTTTYNLLRLALTSPGSLPGADERIVGVQARIRGWRGATANVLRVGLELNNIVEPRTDNWRMANGSGAAAEYRGRIRTVDPTGAPWTAQSITDLRLQMQADEAFGVNVSEVWLEVSWVLAPVVTMLTPTGTQGTTRPEGTWTFEQADGAAMSAYRVKIFDEATFTRPDFNPGTSTPVYTTGVVNGVATAMVLPQDLLNGTYRWYTRAATTVLGTLHWSHWSFVEFPVFLDQPATPVLTATPDPELGSVLLELVDVDNLLTRHDSDLEDSTLGAGFWTGFLANATAARSTAQAKHGSASLLVTAAANGDAAVYPTYLVRCFPGDIVSALVDARAATVSRNVECSIVFFDAAQAQIGAPVTGGAVAAATGAWTAQPIVGATAPALTEYMRPVYRIKSALAGEQFYLDQAKIAPLLSAWSRGGLVVRNLLTYHQSSLEDAGSGTAGWAARTNCVVARTTATAKHGAASLRLTASADGGMSATTDNLFLPIPAKAGQEWTAIASMRAITTAHPCALAIEFLDAAGESVGITNSTPVVSSPSSYTDFVHVAVAPEGTARVALVPLVFDCLAGDQHYVDQNSISLDPSLLWFPGGTGVITQPTIEYTDDPLEVLDDAATWRAVRGTEDLALDLHKTTQLRDYECPPADVRRYRASIAALELGVFLSSPPTATLPRSVPVDVWQIKCPQRPELNVYDAAVIGPVSAKLSEEAGQFQPLADPSSDEPVYPVIVSGGMSGWDGSYRIIGRGFDEIDALEAILTVPLVLLVVSPLGLQRYVRRWGDLGREDTGTADAPRTVFTLPYVQSARP